MKRISIYLLILFSSFAFAQNDVKEHIEKSKQMAHKVSELTGMAVNPLLASGAIGAYKYYSTPIEEKDLLPWYYQPWFFAICFALVGLAFIASFPSIIANFPPQISSFLGLCNKQIGLVVTLPIVLNTIGDIGGDLIEAQVSYIKQPYLYASILPIELPENIWLISIAPMLLFVFFAIWLMNFVFDVFIFLSPFGWVDLGLKILRGIFYAALLAVAILFPQLVFVLVIPIAIISVISFGWSVRRTVMGFVFFKDFLNRKKDTSIDNDGVSAFANSAFGCSAKCYGKLTRQDNSLIFSYKKFFIFKKVLVVNNPELVLRKGFLYSNIYNNGIILCSLPSRYQKIIERVQENLGIQKIETGTLKKGVKGTIEWIKEFRNSVSQKALLGNSIE